MISDCGMRIANLERPRTENRRQRQRTDGRESLGSRDYKEGARSQGWESRRDYLQIDQFLISGFYPMLHALCLLRQSPYFLFLIWHFIHKAKLLVSSLVMNLGELDACGSWQLTQVSSYPSLEGSGTPWVGCLRCLVPQK